MASNLNYKTKFLWVTSEMIGGAPRSSPHAAASGHWWLRNDWLCADRFRALLSRFYAEVSKHGSPWLQDMTELSSRANHLLIKQASYSALDVIMSDERTNYGPFSGKLILRVNDDPITGWNNARTNENAIDLLHQVVEGEGVREGDPLWEFFLKVGFHSAAVWPGLHPKFALLNRGVTTSIFPPPIFDSGEEFKDYTTEFYSPSNVKLFRDFGGQNVTVEPIYNYYADTTPPWETISQKAGEVMLPNFYCLESEMRNTGSVFNSPDYFGQITWNQSLQAGLMDEREPDPWFEQVSGPEGGMTESKTVQLYTLLSSALSTRSTAQINADKNSMDGIYKNMVILNSDLKVLTDLVVRDDNTSGLKNLPFYNKITIGHDPESVSDPDQISAAPGSSWLRDLQITLNNDNPDARVGDQFIDILQLYIIRHLDIADNFGYAAGGPLSVVNNVVQGAQSFRASIKTRVPAEEGHQRINITNETKEINFDLNSFLMAIETDVDTGGTYSESDIDEFEDTEIGIIIRRINKNTSANTGDKYILIRNYGQNPLAVTRAGAAKFLSMWENDKLPSPPVRNARQLILENKKAANETILYKIVKRRIFQNANGTNTMGPPIQTFYVGRIFDQAKDINYIDSQIKYGVRYRYDITAIKLVFGNNYKYPSIQTVNGHSLEEYTGIGRAVGNALGFYEPENLPSDGQVSLGSAYHSLSLDPGAEGWGSPAYVDLDQEPTSVPVQQVGLIAFNTWLNMGNCQMVATAVGYQPTNLGDTNSDGLADIGPRAWRELVEFGTPWVRKFNPTTGPGVYNHSTAVSTLEKVKFTVQDGLGMGGNAGGGLMPSTLDIGQDLPPTMEVPPAVLVDPLQGVCAPEGDPARQLCEQYYDKFLVEFAGAGFVDAGASFAAQLVASPYFTSGPGSHGHRFIVLLAYWNQGHSWEETVAYAGGGSSSSQSAPPDRSGGGS